MELSWIEFEISKPNSLYPLQTVYYFSQLEIFVRTSKQLSNRLNKCACLLLILIKEQHF